MFALSFPGFDLISALYLCRLHARVKSICQSSVVRLHGIQHPSTASGPFSYSSSLLRLS